MEKENGFDDADIDLGMSGHPWSLNIDLNSFSEGGNLASIVGYVFSFTGGAHPNHTFFGINFEKDNQNIIKLDDLFTDSSKALELISEYAVENIIKQTTERLNEKITKDEWVLEGAGPDAKNYSTFVFVSENRIGVDGIKFIFPPCQVGPYYEGTYEVTVPSKLIYDLIRDKYKMNFNR